MINFVVPITGSRLSNAVRFLRNWRQIFEADRSLKLIVSFSGNSTDRDQFDRVLRDELNHGWVDRLVHQVMDLNAIKSTTRKIVQVVDCPVPFTRAPCIQNGLDLLRYFSYSVLSINNLKWQWSVLCLRCRFACQVQHVTTHQNACICRSSILPRILLSVPKI